MHRSWSMPVAQALQRHSGGWSSKPADENTERGNPSGNPRVAVPHDRKPDCDCDREPGTHPGPGPEQASC